MNIEEFVKLDASKFEGDNVKIFKAIKNLYVTFKILNKVESIAKLNIIVNNYCKSYQKESKHCYLQGNTWVPFEVTLYSIDLPEEMAQALFDKVNEYYNKKLDKDFVNEL